MAATVALNASNNIITLTLGGGDAQPAEIDWTSSNKQILELVARSGQPEFQAQVRPVGAGIATVTATLKDAGGNQLQVVNQNVQVTGTDPETETVTFTASAVTPIPAAPGTADPSAPGAAHEVSVGLAPAVAAGANNGGSPPAPTVAAGGNDSRGVVNFGSGSAPAAGAQVAVTFHQPYGAVPAVVLTSGNDATQPLGLEATNVTVNGFTISTHVAPAAAQAVGTYAVEYEVAG